MDVLSEVYDYYRSFSGEKGIFGRSERGRPLIYFKLGRGSPVLLAQYAMHAREYVTAYVALRQADDLLRRDPCGTAYILPLVNPDGTEMCLNGAPLWKANADGVDLNVNFDARWGTGAKNTRDAGAENYIGTAPFCAAESAALRDFTLSVAPDMTLSYHAKGEEIYWYFYQDEQRAERDRAFAELVAGLTGYALKTPTGSAGGYKDWCVETLKIPALTLETGSDALSHPIGKQHAEKIFYENRQVIPELLSALKRGGEGCRRRNDEG